MWMPYGEKREDQNELAWIASACPCRSVRAFRRRLREWSKYLPKGIRFRLEHRYVGVTVIGTTK